MRGGPPRTGAGRDARARDDTARAWALIDLDSGEYLAGENATQRLPMGSTDKIMVAPEAQELVDSVE